MSLLGLGACTQYGFPFFDAAARNCLQRFCGRGEGLRALPGSEVSRPTEESHQLGPFLPQEGPEIPGVDGVSFAAGIGFDTPLEVFAAPWGEPMASCRIPQKADRHAKPPLCEVYPSGEVMTAWG
jgi:hypothetical protein